MTDKKHILILPRWYPNKTDIQLGSFIQQQAILLKEDYYVHVIYVQAIEGQNQPFDIASNGENGIDEQIVYFKSAKGPLKKVINARRYRKAQKLAFVLNPYQPDLVHVHVPYRSAFLALKLKRQGIPFVITEHWSGHLNNQYLKKNITDRRLYKTVLSKAAGIATVSERLKSAFKKNTGFDSVVIPNLILENNQEIKIDSEKVSYLCVADLIDSTKNISGLIRAFHTALQENNQLQLTIIGGGPDEAMIKKLISGLKLNEEVVMRGRLPHEEVLTAYNNCDIYISNSNFETFGMAAAEALMAGKPAVHTKCGGPEEFLNEDNSILVDVADQEELSKAIIRMADRYKNYQPEVLRKDIQQKFGAQKVREQLIAFYEKAMVK